MNGIEMSKITVGIGAGVVVLVVTEWLMISHILSWGISALLAH